LSSEKKEEEREKQDEADQEEVGKEEKNEVLQACLGTYGGGSEYVVHGGT